MKNSRDNLPIAHNQSDSKSTLIRKIITLEKQAAPLEPNKSTRRYITQKVFDYANNYLDTLSSSPVYTENTGEGLYDFPITEDGEEIHKVLDVLREEVDTSGLNPASGGFVAYIPGGGIYYSALGDYLADISNRFAGVYSLGPGAVKMENMIIKWVSSLLGLPQDSKGSLTSGGTVATYTALITAREFFKLKSHDFKKTVLYLTDQTHYCLEKALKVIGMNEAIKRKVPMDSQFRMIPEQLNAMIEEDKNQGLIPWLVVASAGTTNTGSVDPLAKIEKIAKRHGLWFHVDAAYGGFFILTKAGKKVLEGIAGADSIILDPHKSLFIPYGVGLVLIRSKKNLVDAYSYDEASYLKDTEQDDEISPHHASLELTRHFRALRMWLPLKLIGIKPFRAALEEKLLLAKYFYENIKIMENVEVICKPELSIIVFRVSPKQCKDKDKDKLNLDLLKKLRQDGRIYPSSTILNGNVYLRFAFLHFRTHLELIEHALSMIRSKVDQYTEGRKLKIL